MGTYLQEGPNSQMKEEEFYDAVDAGLDRLDEKFDEMMVWCFLISLFIQFFVELMHKEHCRYYTYQVG